MKIKNCKLSKIILAILILGISSLIFNLSAHADQSVRLTVPPRLSDFQFTYSGDGQTTVGANYPLTYTITYGALQSAFDTTTAKIVVDFSNDIAPNRADVLDYVIGSAATGYGGVEPVVDLTNKTISWTIPDIPPGLTDQTVTFQLKTNGNYNGSTPFNFTTTAGMSNDYITEPDQSITQIYKFGLAKPAGPTSIPTKPPPPTPTATPTPTPIPYSYPTAVAQTNISATNATIQVTTTHVAKLSIEYGTSPNALNQTLTTSQYSFVNNPTLTNLQPDTTYYYRVTTTNTQGQTFTSELFTFKTAKSSNQPDLGGNIIVITSNGNIFVSGTQNQEVNATTPVVMTVNSNYQIAYTLTNQIPLKSIEAIVISKILAANTTTMASDEISELTIPMVKQGSTLYVADLKSLIAGPYEIYVRIVDANGNVMQKKIADLKVVPYLSVFDRDTDTPIGDARVFLYYYDSKSNSYQPATPDLFGNIVNPGYTDSQGEITTSLPAGRYQAVASALLYSKQTVDFTLGLSDGQQFPIIYLQKNPLDIPSLFTFIKGLAMDTWTKIFATLFAFAGSIRLFDIFSISITGSFVIVSFLLFMFRSHMHMRHLPVFFFFHVNRLLKKHEEKYLYGTITDEDNKALSLVRIEIEDAKTKTIITHTKSNKSGNFYIPNTFGNEVNLIFSKDGYSPKTISAEELLSVKTALPVVLAHGIKNESSAVSLTLHGVGEIAGMLFETSLVISIILEIFFFMLYGLEKTAPFFILSLLNIILWLFYLHERTNKM